MRNLATQGLIQLMLPVMLAVMLLATATLGPKPASALDLVEPTMAPDTTFLTMQDQEKRLADVAGQIVVVNFWATWCGPCKREMPSLAGLGAALEGHQAMVLTIAVDRASPTAVAAFLVETGATNLETWRDPAMRSMRDFKLAGLPLTLILDKRGRIIARHVGTEEWDSQEMVDLIIGLADHDKAPDLPFVKTTMLQ